MNDGLRSAGLIPTTEPYTALGFTTIGYQSIRTIPQAVLNVTGNNAIVDWVWVELRNATTPTTVLAARPALIQRDGDVVELDGIKPVSMGIANGSYKVVLRHRNHLGVMTANAVALSGTSTTVNLKLLATATYGTEARQDVTGTQVLWGGNVVSDNSLKYTGSSNDRDAIIVFIGGTTPNNSVAGYRAEDVNLDGQVRYTGSGNDRDPILVNVGSTLPTNTRMEQLP
jgi:hypothetical protein